MTPGVGGWIVERGVGTGKRRQQVNESPTPA